VFVNNITAKLLYNLCLLDFFTFGAVVFCEFRVETRFLVGEVVVCVTVVTVVTVITVVTVVTVVTVITRLLQLSQLLQLLQIFHRFFQIFHFKPVLIRSLQRT
jgi:hypothetical protein